MKKTEQQNRQDVINYLEKTSKHLFTRQKDGVVSYDPKDFFRIIKNDYGTFSILKDGKLTPFDYNTTIHYYKENSKDVIKDRLFLNKGYTSIKKSLLKKLEKEAV